MNLKKIGINLVQGVDKYNILCPYHKDKNPSMSVNVAKQLYYCHACNVSGNLIQLYSDIVFGDVKVVPYNSLTNTKLYHIPTLEDYQLEYDTLSFDYPNIILKYLADRMVTLKIAKKIGLKYDNCNTYYPIVIPIYMGKELKGYVRRTIDEVRDVRYMYNKLFQKSSTVHYLYPKKKIEAIILCEGIFDWLALYQALSLKSLHYILPICIFGNKLTEQQCVHILKLKPKTIIIALDDTVTGIRESNRLKIVFERYNLKVKNLYIPIGCKDPGDMCTTDILASLTKLGYKTT